MSSSLALKINNLSKIYNIYDSPQDRIKSFLFKKLSIIYGEKYKNYYYEFLALKKISLDIKKGETVGILGENGSGKSTLLQIISGTLDYSSGYLSTNGRIGALLELGSGFNMEFTGKENVYMNASLMGLSKKEIDEVYSDIIAFADIGPFIDQPVKFYSSGMLLRLAFAVQSQVRPDILIIDEALAVGDTKFQNKCFRRLKDLKKIGTTILFVSHSTEQIITHCDRAILINKGELIKEGPPREVVNLYLDLLFSNEPKKSFENKFHPINKKKKTKNSKLNFKVDIFSTRPGYNKYEYRWGDGSVRICDFIISVNNNNFPTFIRNAEKVKLKCSIFFEKTVKKPILGMNIKTKEGITIYGINSDLIKQSNFYSKGIKKSYVEAEIDFECLLADGDYFISLGVASIIKGQTIAHDRRYDSIHINVQNKNKFYGLSNLNGMITTKDCNY